jgi:hypothetical protein
VATLVPPLEHRLAIDRLRDMRELARTAGPRAGRLPAQRPAPGLQAPGGRRARAGAAHGRPAWRSSTRTARAGDTDPERREPRSATPERLVDAGFARAGDVRDQVTATARRSSSRRSQPGAGARTLVLRKSLNDTRRRRRGRARRAGRWPAGSGILIAVGLGIALGFGLLRRLERLRRDARRLADEGHRAPAGHRRYRATRWARSRSPGDDALAPARRGARPPGLPSPPPRTSCARRWPRCAGTVELLEEELARGAPDLGGSAGAPPQLIARPIA